MSRTIKTDYGNFRSHTSWASRGHSITFSLLAYPFTSELKDKLYALLYTWEGLSFLKWSLFHMIITLYQNFDHVACFSITPTKLFLEVGFWDFMINSKLSFNPPTKQSQIICFRSSLWGWYFFYVDPGHWVPTRVRVSRSVTITVTDPESHAHSAFVDFFTHAFDLPHAV